MDRTELKEIAIDYLQEVIDEFFHDFTNFDDLIDEYDLTDEEIDELRNMNFKIIVNEDEEE